MALGRSGGYTNRGRLHDTPGYDSTKANLDELEKRIENVWLNCLGRIQKMGDRLTVLEAKDAPGKCTYTSKCSWHPEKQATCGNCKKAWRREDESKLVICLAGGNGYERALDAEIYCIDNSCPYHERREA